MGIYHQDIQGLRLRANTNVAADLSAAKDIAAKAASVYDNAEDVCNALDRAAKAYTDGDLSACVTALCEAYDQEVDHLDAPATNFLAEVILEVVDYAEKA